MLFRCFSLPVLILVLLAAVSCSPPKENPSPTEGTVSVNGTELYYKRIGSGDPVVIVHGGPVLEHGYLVPHLKPLAGQYELVFFDQRLSGRSSAEVDSADVRLAAFVNDIEELRQALDLDRIHLVGHSWGGFLAMNYALRYPSNLRSLVLLNSMPASSELWMQEEQILAQRTSPEDKARRQAILNSDTFKTNPPKAIEELLLLSFKPQFFDTTLIDSLHLYIPEDYMTRSRRFGHLMTDIASYDLHPELPALEVPTLLVYGGMEPAAAISGPRLKDAIPNSKLVVIDDAGHFPFIERQELFLSELRYFLGKHKQP